MPPLKRYVEVLSPTEYLFHFDNILGIIFQIWTLMCGRKIFFAEVTRQKKHHEAIQLRGSMKLNNSVQVMLHFALSSSNAAFCGQISFDPIIMHAMQPSAK